MSVAYVLCSRTLVDMSLISTEWFRVFDLVHWFGIDKATFAASWVPKLLRALGETQFVSAIKYISRTVVACY